MFQHLNSISTDRFEVLIFNFRFFLEIIKRDYYICRQSCPMSLKNINWRSKLEVFIWCIHSGWALKQDVICQKPIYAPQREKGLEYSPTVLNRKRKRMGRK